MISRHVVLLAAISAACSSVPEGTQSAVGAARDDLVGAWDAKMTLTRPYPLERGAPSAREVCGAIGFVENHGRVDDGAESNQPRQIGVYDLPLQRIGLEWKGEPPFPVAVASSGSGYDSVPRPPAGRDSVRIVLNPGSEERIVLLGSYDGREIEGEWTAQSARGTAGGAFSMRPHSAGRETLRRCSI